MGLFISPCVLCPTNGWKQFSASMPRFVPGWVCEVFSMQCRAVGGNGTDGNPHHKALCKLQFRLACRGLRMPLRNAACQTLSQCKNLCRSHYINRDLLIYSNQEWGLQLSFGAVLYNATLNVKTDAVFQRNALAEILLHLLSSSFSRRQ